MQLYSQKLFCGCCVVLCALFFTLPAFAESENKVLMLSTQKAFSDIIRSKQYAGPITSAYKLLFNEIGYPEYLLYTPTSRALAIIEEDEAACMLFNRTTDERLQQFLFSKPIAFGIGHKLYQQINSAPLPADLLNDEGEVISVDKVLATRKDELILVLFNSSYGDILDKQLDNIGEHQKVYRYSADEHNMSGPMFLKGRADFALLLHSEINADFNQDKKVPYRRYPIFGVTVPASIHMMCNKTPESRNWLARVDKAMLAIYRTEAYKNVHSRYFDKRSWLLVESLMVETTNE